jgi:hypothetical protein
MSIFGENCKCSAYMHLCELRNKNINEELQKEIYKLKYKIAYLRYELTGDDSDLYELKTV